MYVVKHCHNLHPMGQNISSIGFLSTVMFWEGGGGGGGGGAGEWGLGLTSA